MRRIRAAFRNPRAALYRLTAPWCNELIMRLVTARPVTVAEKVRYKMVRDRRPLLGDLADKITAKEYVARIVGPEYAVDVLATFDDADSICTDGLPDEFVMKVSHASKGMVFVRSDAPDDARLPVPGSPRSRQPVRPEAFDVAQARELFRGWLAQPHGNRFGEWAYSVHPPRIVVEPMLRSASGDLLRDVKLNVLNGRVVTISVSEQRGDGTKVSNRMLRDGTPIDHVRSRTFYGTFDMAPVTTRLQIPDRLPEMIDVAERVSAETDFLRVDLLDLGDRFVVGELTNYPASGMGKTWPPSFARWMGRQWTLPPSYDALGDGR